MASRAARLIGTALACLALVTATAPHGDASAAPAAATWWNVQAGPIRVVSNAGAAEAAILFARMAAIRDLVAQATGRAVGDPVEPVLVLAPKDTGGMREIVGRAARRSRGLSLAAALPSPFGHHVAVRAEALRRQDRLAIHEYVHLLTAVEFEAPPAWLDEGLSEFWSTLQLRGEGLEVGAPIDSFVKILQRGRGWIPVNELVKVPRGRYDAIDGRLEMFYAESWALVHYLFAQTAPDGRSLAPALPGDLGAVDAALRAYVKGPMASLPLPAGGGSLGDPVADRPEPVRLSEAGALAVRASIMAYGEEPQAARGQALRALAADPDEPLALETLGILAFLANDAGQASAWLGRAVRSPSASYRAHYYYGVVKSADRPTAIEHFRRCLEMRPGFAPAIDWLASISKLFFPFCLRACNLPLAYLV